MLGQSDLPEDGENAETINDEDKPYSFQHKTLAQRSAIVFAGPLANFLLAIVLFTGVIIAVGTPKYFAGVGNVQKNSAAAEAGFKVGLRDGEGGAGGGFDAIETRGVDAIKSHYKEKAKVYFLLRLL